jgi:hypothetical protein
MRNEVSANNRKQTLKIGLKRFKTVKNAIAINRNLAEHNR